MVPPHRWVTLGAIKPGQLKKATVLMPDILVVVGKGIEGIEGRYSVDQDRCMAETCRSSARRSLLGLTRNPEQIGCFRSL